MKRILKMIGIFGLVILVGFGCNRVTSIKKTSAPDAPVIDRASILLDAKKQGLIMDTEEIDRMKEADNLVQDASFLPVQDKSAFASKDVRSWRAAALADVTGGSGFGLAHTQFADGIFSLIASVGGLPEPGEGSSYQGWLVKREDGFRALNTGKLDFLNGQFVNGYRSGQDFSAFDFYVVTLQTDALSNIPGEHLLEGEIR